MREIMIRTLTSENHKRKRLSIVEIINKDGVVARAEKCYAYYVSEQMSKNIDPLQLKSLAENQVKTGEKKDRHISIYKSFDRNTGMGQMIYRVIGSFYVVQNLHIFAVVFMHSIKFDMLSPGLTTPPQF